MKRLSEILNYLPIAIYFAYIGLLLTIALNLKWFLAYDSAIENNRLCFVRFDAYTRLI